MAPLQECHAKLDKSKQKVAPNAPSATPTTKRFNQIAIEPCPTCLLTPHHVLERYDYCVVNYHACYVSTDSSVPAGAPVAHPAIPDALNASLTSILLPSFV